MLNILLGDMAQKDRKIITQSIKNGFDGAKISIFDNESIEKFRLEAPDFVLLDDVYLLKNKRLSLINEILVEIPEVKVILLLKEDASLETVNKARSFGVAEFIFRPIKSIEIITRIKNFLLKIKDNNQLFRTPLLELHDTNGRLDASKIAKFLNVSLMDLSKAIGEKYTTVHKTPSSESIQEALIPIQKSLEILNENLGDKKKILIWMNTPQPPLENHKPIKVILDGLAGAVYTLVNNAREGIPT